MVISLFIAENCNENDVNFPINGDWQNKNNVHISKR